MSTTTITHNLPEFPFSPVPPTPNIPSSSHFLTTIASPPTLSAAPILQACHNPEHSQTLTARSQTLTLAQAESADRSQGALTEITEPARAESPENEPSLTETTQQAQILTHESLAPPPKRRSASWRLKRLGNRLAAPIRLCLTACSGRRRAVAFRKNLSSDEASLGSGEYPPEFIRTVLESNSLFGQISVA